jgi:hypothetical protein
LLVRLPAIAQQGRQPRHARHVVGQPWRLASPDAQSGQFARLWPGPAGRLAGFAAWQTPWAALDLYVHDRLSRLAVLDIAFRWAGELSARSTPSGARHCLLLAGMSQRR